MASDWIDPAAELYNEIYKYRSSNPHQADYAVELTGDWLYYTLDPNAGSDDNSFYDVVLECGSGLVDLGYVRVQWSAKSIIHSSDIEG